MSPRTTKLVATYDGQLTNNVITKSGVAGGGGGGGAGGMTGGVLTGEVEDKGFEFNVTTRKGAEQLAVKKPAVRAQASAFGEKGLRSLVLALPTVGTTRGFERDGGEATLGFRYVRSDVWSWALVLCAALGFALGLLLPRRAGGVSYMGLLLIAAVVLSALPYLIAPALTGGPANALLAGILLAGPIHLLIGFERLRREAAERRVVVNGLKGKGVGPVAAALVLGCALFAPSQARAQDKPSEPTDRRVFVPYDPEHPDKASDKVFVPAELYEELWKRAHPESHEAARPAPPAAFATSGVTYEGELSSSGLQLTAHIKVEILQSGWVEAPLGLEGTAVTKATLAPETARLQPQAGGYALVAQGPGTFDVTVELLAPREGSVWSLGTLRSGASVMKLTTHEPGQAIKILGEGALAQREEALAGGGSTVEASLGSESRVRIVYGPREAVAVGGASEASVRSTTLYSIRRGRIELFATFDFDISGEGRESFRFSLPSDVEITSVETDSLRSWHVSGDAPAERFLDVTLKHASGSNARVVVKGERRVSSAQPRAARDRGASRLARRGSLRGRGRGRLARRLRQEHGSPAASRPERAGPGRSAGGLDRTRASLRLYQAAGRDRARAGRGRARAPRHLAGARSRARRPLRSHGSARVRRQARKDVRARSDRSRRAGARGRARRRGGPRAPRSGRAGDAAPHLRPGQGSRGSGDVHAQAALRAAPGAGRGLGLAPRRPHAQRDGRRRRAGPVLG